MGTLAAERLFARLDGDGAAPQVIVRRVVPGEDYRRVDRLAEASAASVLSGR
jgi:hypothetical protein